MTDWRRVPKKLLDPSIIEQAPVDIDGASASVRDSADDEYLVGILSEQLNETQAENDRLKAQRSIEDVKAGMLETYGDRVYYFVMGYCIVVAFFLIISGYKNYTKFQLNDTILAIIAGSTAVAVIGLIGMVVSGLFGSSQKTRE